jgi:hypothetical protein
MKHTNDLLREEFQRLEAMVIQKNIDYKDSLQNPVSTFLRSEDQELGILARLDDKLGRIRESGINEHTVDTIDDLVGYLVHLRISLRKKGIK